MRVRTVASWGSACWLTASPAFAWGVGTMPGAPSGDEAPLPPPPPVETATVTAPISAPEPAPAAERPPPAPTQSAPYSGATGKPPPREPASTDSLPSPAPWYGWQVLMVDGISVAVGVTALATVPKGRPNPWLAAGILGYWLGPGVIHGLHGNWLRGLASVGLRMGLPAMGAVSGQLVVPCEGSRCDSTPTAVGAITGLVAATAFDAAVLAYGRKPNPPAGGLQLIPAAAAGPEGLELSLAGTF